MQFHCVCHFCCPCFDVLKTGMLCFSTFDSYILFNGKLLEVFVGHILLILAATIYHSLDDWFSLVFFISFLDLFVMAMTLVLNW